MTPHASALPSLSSDRVATGSFWTIRASEARAHALIVAVVLWTAALLNTIAGTGIRSLAGPLKGGDFVHFYTLGAMARSPGSPLYDAAGQDAIQVALVPDSAGHSFEPAYPPQVAVFFMPFARLPYWAAALLWASITLVVYSWCVYLAWFPSRKVFSDYRFVLAAAFGSAPIWYLTLNGQTTPIVLAIFVGAWSALERDRRWLAGLILGGLAIKPQFGIVLAIVVLATGEWAMLAGAACAVALQVCVTSWLFGPSIWLSYLNTVRHFSGVITNLEQRPFLLHSVQAWTRLLPSPWSMGAWVIVTAAVSWEAVRVWRTGAPVRVRFGVLLLATVLVNPHLFLYDATVLVLPILWIGGWLEQTNRPIGPAWWHAVYGLSVMLLLPTAALVGVQISVVFLGWLFVRSAQEVCSADTPSVRVA